MTIAVGTAAALIQTGKLATIHAARPIQIEWLGKIIAATQKMRFHVNDVAALDKVDRAMRTLLLELQSPTPLDNKISSAWLQIITGLLIAIRDMDDYIDTGEIIDVFSQFAESCGAA